MNILLFLIPVSMVLLLVAVWAFRWAVRKGQFENLDAAAIDILRDDSADQAPDAAAPSRSDDGGAGHAAGEGRDAD
jgi:cbb3-type cytochrome oxidase maturation protein